MSSGTWKRALGVAAVLAILFCAFPARAATLTITGVNPASPVLAGTQVFVNGTGFPAGGTVTFDWNGTASPETAVADGSGAISGATVTVPMSLQPGNHNLIACSPAPSCSAAFPMVVGPLLSTTASMPRPRASAMTVKVEGLQPFTTAIFGWNGAMSSTGQAVPDQPFFTIATTVPAAAPANSFFQVCEQQSGSTCKSTVQSLGRLNVSVVVPVPTTAPPAPVVTTPPVTQAPPPIHHRRHVPVPAVIAATPPPPPATLKPTSAPTPQQTTEAPAPSQPMLALPVSVPAPLFSQTAVVHLEVTAFAILSVLGGGAMLRGIAGLAVPAGPRGGTAGSAKVKFFGGDTEGGGSGDRSRTWRSPGTAALDRVSLTAPTAVAPASPLLARVLVDGSYLRAMLGMPSLLLPIAGGTLGVLAVSDTGGHALPPILGLLATMAVLGIFDALAGFLAAAVFTVGVAVSGGLSSAKDVRTMLGIGVVLFAVPLIAAAARPLRRTPGRSGKDRRTRTGDLVIASLIGAWAIQKMTRGLPGLAEQPLAIARDAGLLALIVLTASAVRIGLEEVAARFYPARLQNVQPASVPRPGTPQRVLASVLRTLVFVFFVVAFLGQHWQLWVGGGLFLLPQLISIVEHRFPNSDRLHRLLPRGLLKIVVMLVIGTLLGQLVLNLVGSAKDAGLNAFVVLSAISLLLSVIEVFGRDGREPEEGLVRWLAGVGVLAIGVLLVLGYVTV